MASKLTTQNTTQVAAAPPPTGIINHLEDNGIELEYQDAFRREDGSVYLDRDGNPIPKVDSDQNAVLTPKTPEELNREAEALAIAVFRAIGAEDALTYQAPHPYSPSNEQVWLARLEADRIAQQEGSEEKPLRAMILDPDPTKSARAARTLRRVEPKNRPEHHQLSTSTKKLEGKVASKGKTGALKRVWSGRSWEEKVLSQQKKKREDLETTPITVGGKIRRFKKEHPEALKAQLEQYRRSKTFRAQRKMGRKLGIDEEEIARTFPGKGSRSQVKYLEKLDRAEQQELRNQFGRKGAVLEDPSGRKFYVYDVLSTPAQAYRVVLSPEGIPVFETDDEGNPRLHPIYLPKRDSKGKVQYRENGTAILEDEPLPRQDNYLSGKHKDGRQDELLDILYYEDGTPIRSECYDASSFDPADDIVILKPLLTGAEAIRWILEGEGVQIKDTHVTVKQLEQEVINKTKTILQDQEPKKLRLKRRAANTQTPRTDALKEHYIFKAEDHTTKPEFRPPKDRAEHTGHFSRPAYPAGLASREKTVLRALLKYARLRQDDATKKSVAARLEMLK
jgi:hypothetical protein